MTTMTKPARFETPTGVGSSPAPVDGLPIVVGPAAALVASQALPPWAAMWLMAFAVYFGLKWLVWRSAAPSLPGYTPVRFFGYFFLWPGMNPTPFFPATPPSAIELATTGREWFVAATKTAAGLAAFALVGPLVHSYSPFVAGWIGMIGLILLLHSGTFHLAALAWRHAGVAVEPIMDNPLGATSLADFWGRRWNRAFRDLVDPLIFRPLLRRYGPRIASWGVFLFSGLVHDLVIAIPARGGYGMPTLYFLLQAAVVELTHSSTGRRWGLRRGLRARALAAVTLIGPLGLLAPRPFVENCILPLMSLWR